MLLLRKRRRKRSAWKSEEEIIKGSMNLEVLFRNKITQEDNRLASDWQSRFKKLGV